MEIDCTTVLLKKTAMAVSLVGGAGVKRALSESEDSEYSEDEAHYSTASLLLVSNVHPTSQNGAPGEFSISTYIRKRVGRARYLMM